MTVENLEIKITQTGANAASAINKVASSVNKIRTPTTKATSSLKGMNKAFQSSASAAGKLLKSIGRIGFYRAIRMLTKAVFSAFKEGLKNAYHFSKAINGTLASSLDALATKSMTMKNALGSAFAGLLQAVQPILIRIIQLVTQAANAIAAFFGALNGGTYLQAKDTATAWDEATGAAGAYKRTVMGFDEINKLDGNSGGGGGTDYSGMFTEVKVPEKIQQFADKFTEIKNKITENLAAIELAASASALALGLILLCTGNVKLGLGLIAVGAVGLAKAVSADWSSVSAKVAETIAEIMIVVGGGLLAIGAILAFSGANIPLGIGLMAAGVATTASVMIAWDSLPAQIKRKVKTVGTIVSGGLLAIGALFAFACPAMLGVGIAMMAVGAAGLVASIALDWDHTSLKIKNALASIYAIVSVAFLAIGAIMLFNPATMALGLGLLYAGAKGMVAAYDLSDNAITRAVLNMASALETTINTYIISPLNTVLGLLNTIFGTNWNIGFLNNATTTLLSSQSNSGYGSSIVGTVKGGVFQSTSSIVGTVRNGVYTSTKKYANGGYPNSGSLFIAGEAGAELVSSHGGQTQVSNTDQIAASVAVGNGSVVNAIDYMANRIVSAIASKNTNVYLDSRQIRKGQERLERAMG